MTEFKDIKAFAFDVDGVFTDGSLLATPDGDLLRIFNAKDTFAVRTAVIEGYPVAIITGGCSSSLVERFKTLGINKEDLYMFSRDKAPDLEHFCRRHGLELSQVLFAGDDMPDIPAMKCAGIAACPADGCEEVQEAADYISEKGGGRGFVREVVKKVLSANGHWRFDPKSPLPAPYPDHIAQFATQTGKNV